MKLEKWALAAEIVSAVAIVLSLIFVGVQVRQGNEETAANARALEAGVRESMLNTDFAFLQAQMQFPHIFRLRRSGGVPTNPDDVVRMSLLTNMLIRSRENYWNQWANGMLDDDTYWSYRETLLIELETAALAQEAWSFLKSTLVPGFFEEIDSELERRGREASPQ